MLLSKSLKLNVSIIMHHYHLMKGARYRKAGWMEMSKLLWRPLLLEWELTKRMSGLSFIILYQKVWKVMLKNVVELVVTGRMLNVFFIILTQIGKNTIGLFATTITQIIQENNKT